MCINPSCRSEAFAYRELHVPGSYGILTACEQYADWWEVLDQDGQLLYRRILLHSHVEEQPFTRSGGPVEVDPDLMVYVRAHMNTSGYGGQVMRGTVRDGFGPVAVEAGFGSGLERVPPQPEDCAF